MKQNYLTFPLLFTALSLFAQSSNPGLLWVTPIQSAIDSPDEIGIEVMDVAVSPEGNTYMAGYCTAPCAFGPGAVVAPDAGGQSIFIAKYKPGGQFEWVKDLGTIGDGPIYLSAPFLDGVFLATSFSVPVVALGNGISVTKNCNGSGCYNGLLAKIDPSGATLWAKTYTGSANSYFRANGITHTGIGKIAAMFTYGSDLLSLGQGFVFDDKPDSGFFVSFFDAGNGVTTDVKFPGYSLDDMEGRHIAFNQNGAGLITGIFFNQIDFPNSTTLTTTDPLGAHFVAGLDASGNVQWANKLSSSDYMEILSAVVDGGGNALLAIDMSENLELNNNQILTVNTNYASTVLKLNGAGFSIPVFIPYESDDYAVMDVAVDGSNNIYTIGYISETISFNNTPITPDGCVDGFLTRTDANGLPIGARTIGGGGCEAYSNYYYGSCMGFDGAGFLYAAGAFLFNFNEDGINFNGRGGMVSKFNTGVVGTEEPTFGELDIFPNPNSGAFTVRLPEMPENPSQVIITNTQGQEVYRQEMTQQELQINYAFPSGLYLISIQEGNRMYRGKIRVE